jgi:hypothetical protein
MQPFEKRIWAETERSRGVLAACLAPMLDGAEMEGTSSRDKAIATWKRKAKETWSEIFYELGNLASTQQLAQHTKRSSVNIHNVMEKLCYYQLVERAGFMRSTKGKRPQIMWRWIGK